MNGHKGFCSNHWLLASSIFVVIGGLVLFFFLKNTTARDTAKDGESKAAPAGKAELGFADGKESPEKSKNGKTPDTVGVEVVKRNKTLHVTGSLAADEISNVASNVNGIVVDIRVDRGSVVKKGDVMVQLDPTDAKNKLSEGLAVVEELKTKLSLSDNPDAPFVAEDQPEAKLGKATWDLAISRKKRAENLLPQKAISLDEFEQIRAEAECAAQRYQAAVLQSKQTYQAYQTNVTKLAAMRKLLRDTTILAPFDGIVVEKHTALGEQVTGGFVASKVVTIVRTSPMRISLTVPQQHIASISPGQKVHFQVDSFPGKTFEGKVKYISPVVTNDTRSMVVEALTSNEDGLLRPGLFVTADLELPERQTHIFVPAESVQKVGEAARVFVVHGKDVREQVVALGKEDGKRIEIVSGLEENELVVRNPEQLREGAVVKK